MSLQTRLAAEVPDGEVVGARVITREWDEGVFDRTDLRVVVLGPAYTSKVGRAGRLAISRSTGEPVGFVLEGEPVIVDALDSSGP